MTMMTPYSPNLGRPGAVARELPAVVGLTVMETSLGRGKRRKTMGSDL
ncbi:hypothetical protein [Deinococcus sp. QL22]|nr:hypothetical protein [Deinococcus sp. QL22]UQN09700.1 hypothetical protein M1R55_24830 [Deinococcus sp. QL22]